MKIPPISDLAGGLAQRRPFSLSRWFALMALTSIVALAATIGVLLNNFLTERMVARRKRR
jgi:hypothetical protein